MAAPTSSSRDDGLRRSYEVFLSFRGPDTRLTIVDTLYNDLIRAGICTFKDDEELQFGEEIEGGILQAMNDSKIYIPIFSKDYASSKWCLRELASIVELSQDNDEKVILPIFYDVDIDDVKLKTELYRKALQKHESESGKDLASSWEEALKLVARIRGRKLSDHGLDELNSLTVKEVSSRLWTKRTDVPNHLVGMKGPKDDIMKKLDLGSFDVRYIVIHGMGGIGKTTLANLVFRQISPQFHDYCCFLEDVRTHVILNLQKKLLFDILKPRRRDFSNTEVADMIKTRFRDKKVLIVLDDIDNRDQVMRLAGELNWFGGGSRIIITTRNIEFLIMESEDDSISASNREQFSFYEMSEMNSRDALQLFCEHALGCAKPPLDYVDTSNELISALGRLPLALEVVGSTLRGKSQSTWKDALCKLKKVMNNDVKKKLMISYEALEPNQRQIYLDIACSFIHREKTIAIKYWDAVFKYPIKIEVKILARMSLIKIINSGELWMHDQLRDLGREIIDVESNEIHLRGSRLWSPKDAFHIVQRKMGTENIVGLNLGTPEPNVTYKFKREEFARLVKLRFLRLNHGNFKGDFKNLFFELRWLSWSYCPPKFQATNFGLENLVVLELCRSNITADWGGWSQIMVAKQLKVLKLVECSALKETPKFSSILRLEILIFSQCNKLTKIDESIGNLQHLDHLDIECDAIRSLPKSIGRLKSLTKLRVTSRRYLVLPDSITDLEKLKHLILSSGELQDLPDSIGGLKSLTELRVTSRRHLVLPDSIADLGKLKHIILSCRELQELPNSIGGLKSLTELRVTSRRLSMLPDSLVDLGKLKYLILSCEELQELPNSIGELESVFELDVGYTRIRKLPCSIGNLKKLKILKIYSRDLERLPNSVGRLKSLVELDVSPSTINVLSDCIGEIKKLKELNLYESDISELPKSIELVKNLERFRAEFRRVVELFSRAFEKESSFEVLEYDGCLWELPTTINQLTNLQILELRGCRSIQQLPELPKSLTRLSFSWDSLTTIPNFSNLSNLVVLITDGHSVLEPCIEGLERLQALKILTLDVGERALAPTDPSSLSQLQRLLISYADSRSLISLPSSLQYLTLADVRSPINWSLFSNLENLSMLSIQGYSLGEIRFEVLGKLRKFNTLRIQDCSLLKTLPVLPGLKEIRSLQLGNLPQLTEIEGLGELKSLQTLFICGCDSVKSLNESDLSNLQNLKRLELSYCESLERMPDMPKFCYLSVDDCPMFNRDG